MFAPLGPPAIQRGGLPRGSSAPAQSVGLNRRFETLAVQVERRGKTLGKQILAVCDRSHEMWRLR